MKYFFILLFIITGVQFSSFAQNNVGIGKANPSHTLDVAGSINSDSSYRLRNRIVLSTGYFGGLYVGDSAGGQIPFYETSHNTLMGERAGARLTAGTGNAFFGGSSGYSATGSHNSFFGGQAGRLATTGGYNSMFGYGAGQYNDNSQMNSFFGYLAGNAHEGLGSFNTILGAMSGHRNFIGTHNTFVGYNVDHVSNAVFTIDNSTAIGFEARVSASNQIRFGNGNVTSIGGYVGWSNLSDGRFKKNITENVKGLAFITKLRPVSYALDLQKLYNHLNTDDIPLKQSEKSDAIIHTGFIAQEVEQAAKEAGFVFSGVDAPKNPSDTYALRYAEFTVPLVKAVQELAAQNEAMRKEIDAIKAQLKNR